jgi:hypothetical protein
MRIGLTVEVTRFGSDGWEDGHETWFENAEDNPQTLAQFLAAELHVPGPEASALAQDILGPWVEEWESRGGDQEARTFHRLTIALIVAIGILLVLACTAIVLLVLLLVT